MKPGGGGGAPAEPNSLIVHLSNSSPSHNYTGRTSNVVNIGGRHRLPVSPPGPQTQVTPRHFLPARRPRPIVSPKKNHSEDDFMEGVVEKRPKYYKHLPLNYQYVLQDHNYCAARPCGSPVKGLLGVNHNGVTSNGLSPLPPPLLAPGGTPCVGGVGGLLSPPVGATPCEPGGGLPPRDPPNQAPPSVLLSTSSPAPLSLSSLPPPPSLSSVGGGPSVGGHHHHHHQDESDLSSDGEPPAIDGEETETAPEDEDSVTRCICEFQHDDGYMICCDKCLVWQHVDCMGIERGNIPEEYRCEECEPRRVDKAKAVRIQLAKRGHFHDSSDSSTNNTPTRPAPVRKRPTSTSSTGGRRRDRGNSGGGGSGGGGGNATGGGGKAGGGGGGGGRWRNDKPKPKHKPKPKSRKSVPVRKASTSSISSLDKKTSESSPPGASLGSPPISNSTNDGSHLSQLRQWIDSYEEAVTNHYSPELRARIAAIKLNGVHSDLRLPANLHATPKCRVSLLPSGIKILVTTANVQSNQAIIEVRGKYMLVRGGGSAPPPSAPHVFHHSIGGGGGDGGGGGSGGGATSPTEVCIDARTYGNDARFVRRSCTPNAEVRHCIEKGALHLYIVSRSYIEARTEITLPWSKGGQPCSCSNPEKCPARNPPPPPSADSNNGDKRRRGRRRTVSESSTGGGGLGGAGAGGVAVAKQAKKHQVSPLPSPNQEIPTKITRTSSPLATEKTPPEVAQVPRPVTPPATPVKDPPPPSATTPIPQTEPPTTTPLAQQPPSAQPSVTNPQTAPTTPQGKGSKAPLGGGTPAGAVTSRRATTPATRHDENKRSASVANPVISELHKAETKMTREERKMEAIMKAFERLEKDEARKQQSGPASGGRETRESVSSMTHTTRTRKNSSPSLERNNKKKTRVLKESRVSKPTLRSRRGGGGSATRKTASNATTPGNNNHRRTTGGGRNTGRGGHNNKSWREERRKRRGGGSSEEEDDDEDEEVESGDSESEEEIVGSRRRGGLPRRRGTAPQEVTEGGSPISPSSSSPRLDHHHFTPDKMEDGLKESGSSSESTPPPAVSNTCLLVAAAVGPLAPGFKFPKTKRSLMNSWFGERTPDSPGPPPDCAKKRWLRQAISEDADSPAPQGCGGGGGGNGGPPTPQDPGGPAAPLKKRRFARQSCSEDPTSNNFTPPTTPNTQSQMYDEEDNSMMSPQDEFCSTPHPESQSDYEMGTSRSSFNGGPRTPPQPPSGSEDGASTTIPALMAIKKEEPESRSPTTAEGSPRSQNNSVLAGLVKQEPHDPGIKREPVGSNSSSPSSTPIKQEAKDQEAKIKRKLSISEYRERTKSLPQSLGGQGTTPTTPPSTKRSNGGLTSDDDEDDDSKPGGGSDRADPATTDYIAKSLLFAQTDEAFKKGVLGSGGFSAAPTLVEAQREALTDRLRREFGLFLSDDEEMERQRQRSNATGSAAAGIIPPTPSVVNQPQPTTQDRK